MVQDARRWPFQLLAQVNKVPVALRIERQSSRPYQEISNDRILYQG